MNDTTTPPAGATGKGAGKKGAGKKGPANKEARAHKVRLREIKVEKQGLAQTIKDAKARRETLEAELKTIRAALPARPAKAT
jgi:hypothetical protein